MLIQDGVAKAQTVEIGIEDEGMVQILSGLKPGDQVVTTGAYALDDGSKVKVVSSSEMEKDAGGKAKPEAITNVVFANSYRWNVR